MSNSNRDIADECPKRPQNAYFRFLAENRESVKGEGFREKLKELWENFDPKIKAEYEQEYKEQMEQYKKDMEAWKSKGGKIEKKEKSVNKQISKPEKEKGAKKKEGKKDEKKVEEKAANDEKHKSKSKGRPKKSDK
jgi:hypothetical protein